MITEQILQKYFVTFEQNMNKRFELIDRRFESIDKRFEAIDRRFDKVDVEIGALRHDVYGLADKVQENTVNIEGMRETMVTKVELKNELRIMRVQMDRKSDVVIEKYSELKHDVIKPLANRIGKVELHLGV